MGQIRGSAIEIVLSNYILLSWQVQMAQARFTISWCSFPPRIEDIIKANLDPLMQSLDIDVKWWSSLFLSLWGKVNVIKMKLIEMIDYLLNKGIPREWKTATHEYVETAAAS